VRLLEFAMSSISGQQWLCQKIVEQLSTAIIFGDREGIVRLWNAGAEAMFGWKELVLWSRKSPNSLVS
jgi:PAS domain S-box-containing protein